jgi:hypothetical protein
VTRRYRVTAKYILVKTATPIGTAVVGLTEGSTLPADVPEEQITHHLSTGQIKEVD